jgi:hypothetical protein
MAGQAEVDRYRGPVGRRGFASATLSSGSWPATWSGKLKPHRKPSDTCSEESPGTTGRNHTLSAASEPPRWNLVALPPRSHVWNSIRPHFERGDWDACLRLVKAVVDADPFDVPKRYLLARIYLKVGDPAQALVHFEKLLPLCVGRGELFRALAMQKHLDLLSTAIASQPQRYSALHRWFRSLAPAGSSRIRSGAVAQEALLLGLTDEGFTRVAAACELDLLDPGVSTLRGSGGTLWIVVHGELSACEGAGADGWGPPRELEEGHYLSVDPGRRDRSRVRFESSTPVELLRLEGDRALQLAAVLPELAAGLEELLHAKRTATEPPSLSRPVRPVVEPPGGANRASRPETGAAGEAGSATDKPHFTPALRVERRNYQRVQFSAVGAQAAVEVPGAPGVSIPAKLRNLSYRGMCVTIAADQDLGPFEPYIRSVIYVELGMPGGAQRPLRLSGWVRWCCQEEGSWVVGVEFARLTPLERETLGRFFSPELAEEQYRFEAWERRGAELPRRRQQGRS